MVFFAVSYIHLDVYKRQFWHSLKNELVHRQPSATRAAATAAIFDYIEAFYNRVRLHSSIGYRPTAASEAAHTQVAA